MCTNLQWKYSTILIISFICGLLGRDRLLLKFTLLFFRSSASNISGLCGISRMSAFHSSYWAPGKLFLIRKAKHFYFGKWFCINSWIFSFLSSPVSFVFVSGVPVIWILNAGLKLQFSSYFLFLLFFVLLSGWGIYLFPFLRQPFQWSVLFLGCSQYLLCLWGCHIFWLFCFTLLCPFSVVWSFFLCLGLVFEALRERSLALLICCRHLKLMERRPIFLVLYCVVV